jgi:hypothetical protein
VEGEAVTDTVVTYSGHNPETVVNEKNQYTILKPYLGRDAA